MKSSGRLVRCIAVSLNVARSVRDVLKHVAGGLKIRQEGDDLKGDHFVHLQSDLGDRGYAALCEDENLALEDIYYCQRALENKRIKAQGGANNQETVSPAQGELKRVQRKDLINHDYLVLKLRPGDPTAEVVHIKAEKNDKGIYIEHIPSSAVTSVVHDGVHCFTVACEKKRIRLEALVAILKEESPHYSSLFANCWYYAQKTAKRLMKACIETPGISSAEKARLQEEHDYLQANLIVQALKNVKMRLSALKHLQQDETGNFEFNWGGLAPLISTI